MTDIDRPVQELKVFHKTRKLEPMETESLILKIPLQDLSFWDEKARDWKLEKGTYTIKSGSSSKDIKVSGNIELDNL